MVDFKDAIREYYEREINIINSMDLDEINIAMNAIGRCYEMGGTIYVCGNGGSASTASHMQNDFNRGISQYVDKKFNFYCLNDNYPTMMAIANDTSYDEIFRTQLKNRITPNDLFVGISCSGNSNNVVYAAEYAKECGAKVIGITGFRGGLLDEMADYHMHVPIDDMQIVEDIHLTFDHMMMKLFHNYLVNQKVSGQNLENIKEEEKAKVYTRDFNKKNNL